MRDKKNAGTFFAVSVVLPNVRLQGFDMMSIQASRVCFLASRRRGGDRKSRRKWTIRLQLRVVVIGRSRGAMWSLRYRRDGRVNFRPI